MALAFSACGAGVMTYKSIIGNGDAMTALIGMVGIVLGFYFGVKSQSL
jgi:hypothetical protein